MVIIWQLSPLQNWTLASDNFEYVIALKMGFEKDRVEVVDTDFLHAKE